MLVVISISISHQTEGAMYVALAPSVQVRVVLELLAFGNGDPEGVDVEGAVCDQGAERAADDFTGTAYGGDQEPEGDGLICTVANGEGQQMRGEALAK